MKGGPRTYRVRVAGEDVGEVTADGWQAAARQVMETHKASAMDVEIEVDAKVGFIRYGYAH